MIFIVLASLGVACGVFTAAVLGQYTPSEILVFVFAAALGGLGAVFTNIDPTSKCYFLQKLSAVEIANVNILFTRFRGLNLFGSCADYTIVIICSLPSRQRLLSSCRSLKSRSGRRPFAVKMKKVNLPAGVLSLQRRLLPNIQTARLRRRNVYCADSSFA